MQEDVRSYRSILKATSIFGGVQLMLILISIIRSKLTAIILGPSGMGIIGLLNSTISLVVSITSFSIGVSAVKNVSEANVSGNISEVNKIVKIVSRLAFITGVFGMITCIVFSPLLSKLTFQNYTYTSIFLCLSITVLLTQLNSSNLVILQGMRKVAFLAKSNFLGSLVGLFVTIPLFYFLKKDGILPSLLLISIITFLFSKYFSRKIKFSEIKIEKTEFFNEGKKILVNGFAIGFTGMITMATSYILNIYINKIGGAEEVGLYTAGFMLINSYTGLVFSAISSDYHPRLSSLGHSQNQTNKAITQQAEVAILILAPLICGMIVFLPLIVKLLYNENFLRIQSMLYWVLLGVLLKAASWSISFVFVAQGKIKIFFKNEIIANVYVLLLNIFGYSYMGLEGLGISFMVSYFIYLIHMYVLSKRYFNFSFTQINIRLLIFNLLVLTTCIFICYIFSTYIRYIFGTTIFVVVLLVNMKILNNKSDIIGRLFDKKFKINNV